MLPVLFSFGPIKIYTFGVFLVLAFFWGSFFLWKLVRLTVYKEEEIFDGLFLSLGFALFFARLFYVASNFSDFGFNLLKFILINGYPGLSLPGGLLGGFLFAFLFFFTKKRNFYVMVDYFIPPLFVALGFGFLGVFFSQKNSLPFLLNAFIFFFSALVSYRLIFLIRQKRLNKSFNLIVFLLIISLGLGLIETGIWRLIFFILLLTSGGYILYYFKTVIFNSLKEWSKKIFYHVKKFFSKRVKRDQR